MKIDTIETCLTFSRSSFIKQQIPRNRYQGTDTKEQIPRKRYQGTKQNIYIIITL